MSRNWQNVTSYVTSLPGPKITKKDTGNRGAEVERRRRENPEEGGVWGGGVPLPIGEGASAHSPEIFFLILYQNGDF